MVTLVFQKVKKRENYIRHNRIGRTINFPALKTGESTKSSGNRLAYLLVISSLSNLLPPH